MRVVAVEAWALEFRLDEPYAIAYEEVDRVGNVFLRLATDGRVSGYGCAAPAREVTGETAESVLAALRSVAEPILRGADPVRRARAVEELRRELKDQPAALAAADMALHDLQARTFDVPLWQLLGGFRDSILTSVTIGILPLEETVAAARRRVAEGFGSLKLKGGRDVEQDAARALAVRRAVGPAVELRFDANQGYGFEESVRFVDAAREARLELLEQPTASGQPDLLGRVTAAVELPVMADESLINLRDAFRLAGGDVVDMVNVKLMKVGGITQALHVDSVARAARMETMIGCMDESALAIAAGLSVALALPNVAYADLDGHLGLEGDPAAGAVTLRDGVLYPSMRPGLGIDL